MEKYKAYLLKKNKTDISTLELPSAEVIVQNMLKNYPTVLEGLKDK